MSDAPEQSTRCGFVALVGAPNAGKSTLLNRLVGSKVSIVTPKVQTTRSRVTGICIAGRSQLVFVDTPGIFAPRRRLDRAMVEAAWSGARDADIVVVLVDAKRGVDADVRRIVDGLEKSGHRALLALNKIDRVKPAALLPLAAELDASGVFSDTFMISALTGDGVGDLRDFLAAHVPAGPWLYPEDQLSDMPLRLLAAEVTREQLFLQLHQELPYALTVETESWQERDDGSLRIDQVVYLQRDSHKPMVLGKGGRRVKEVGSAARRELETLLERRVHLFLHVKVAPKWADDPERYRDLGLEFPR
ncbi:MAG: GTPase Era [Alphaproteobacteria bacterium]